MCMSHGLKGPQLDHVLKISKWPYHFVHTPEGRRKPPHLVGRAHMEVGGHQTSMYVSYTHQFLQSPSHSHHMQGNTSVGDVGCYLGRLGSKGYEDASHRSMGPHQSTINTPYLLTLIQDHKGGASLTLDRRSPTLVVVVVSIIGRE